MAFNFDFVSMLKPKIKDYFLANDCGMLIASLHET